MATVSAPAPGQRYKFVVRSAEEATAAIRERLGENARVISVRQVEGEGFARFLRAPRLEVVAEFSGVTETAADLVPEPMPVPFVAKPLGTPPPHGVWEMLERAGIRREFRVRVEDRPEWHSLAELPLHSGLARAASLLRRTSAGEDRPLSNRAAFFGSPGVGATTALCKQLAADVFLRSREACVMKLDGDEPNSIEGLAMFCEALGVPLLRSPAEMAEVTEDAVVYFDVPGAIPGAPANDSLRRAMDDLGIGSRVLVANAAYERELIQQAYVRANDLGGTHVVFTHLDELPRCGKLWEFVIEGSLSPLFGSCGANLAGDRECALVDHLVRRTLAAGSL